MVILIQGCIGVVGVVEIANSGRSLSRQLLLASTCGSKMTRSTGTCGMRWLGVVEVIQDV